MCLKASDRDVIGSSRNLDAPPSRTEPPRQAALSRAQMCTDQPSSASHSQRQGAAKRETTVSERLLVKSDPQTP